MTRRLIDSKIRSSETFARFTLRQRDLWHGLLVVVDDQGRAPANPAFVRAHVWPFDDFSLADVETDLQALEQAGNIMRYDTGGRYCLQIVNWWKYQAPQWCNSSAYPPPDGWVDRVRVHRAGNKVETVNWETAGGFIALPTNVPSPLPTPLPTPVPIAIKGVNVNGEGDVKDDVKVLDKTDHPDGDLSDLSIEFATTAGIREYTGGSRYIEALSAMKDAGAQPGDITAAVKILRDKGFIISGPWSLLNTIIGLIGQRTGTVKAGYIPRNGNAGHDPHHVKAERK